MELVLSAPISADQKVLGDKISAHANAIHTHS
jgi:hypothetical protein